MPDVLIRNVPKSLHTQLTELASKEGVSLQELLLHLISQPMQPDKLNQYLSAVNQEEYELNRVIKENTEILTLLTEEMEEHE